MKTALAALLVALIGMGPGFAKYAGPPPQDPSKPAGAPAEIRADAPSGLARPAGVAALIARLRRS